MTNLGIELKATKIGDSLYLLIPKDISQLLNIKEESHFTLDIGREPPTLTYQKKEK